MSQEKKMPAMAIIPVSSSSVRLMPSAARWYSMPSDGTHGTRVIVSISPVLCCTNTVSVIPNPAMAVSSARMRAAPTLPLGSRSRPAAPRNEM